MRFGCTPLSLKDVQSRLFPNPVSGATTDLASFLSQPPAIEWVKREDGTFCFREYLFSVLRGRLTDGRLGSARSLRLDLVGRRVIGRSTYVSFGSSLVGFPGLSSSQVGLSLTIKEIQGFGTRPNNTSSSILWLVCWRNMSIVLVPGPCRGRQGRRRSRID